MCNDDVSSINRVSKYKYDATDLISMHVKYIIFRYTKNVKRHLYPLNRLKYTIIIIGIGLACFKLLSIFDSTIVII